MFLRKYTFYTKLRKYICEYCQLFLYVRKYIIKTVKEVTTIFQIYGGTNMNTLSINIPANFIFTCENTLARYAADTNDSVKRAILDRQTVNGINWAIDFCKSLDTDYMTESQLSHAIRLTRFRGQTCPVFRG